MDFGNKDRTLYIGSQGENKTMLRSELPISLCHYHLCVKEFGGENDYRSGRNTSKRSDCMCMAKNEVRATNRVLAAI